MAAWHSDAIRVPYSNAGAFLPVPRRIVWHTVEGYNLPNYQGTAPHFTLSIKTGNLWQHVAIDKASKSLEHPSGTVETNHAGAIQVELTDAFAKDSQNWPPIAYARIASLARWIEKNAGVARKCSVTFAGQGKAVRLSPAAWLAYSGHCGHQHVPAQPLGHWDPGALRIGLVLGTTAAEANVRKRHVWAVHLARIRLEAKRYGWTKPRRIAARQLKRLLSR